MLLGLVLSAMTMTASAQFERGAKYINTSLSGLGLSYSKNEKVHLDVRLMAGYFLGDGCMLYAGVDYAHQPHLNQVGVDFGGRYYIRQNGIFLGCGLKYAHGEETTDEPERYTRKHDNFFFTPEVGYAFYVNHYLTIEPSVYYNMSFDDFADASKVGLRIGFGFYF